MEGAVHSMGRSRYRALDSLAPMAKMPAELDPLLVSTPSHESYGTIDLLILKAHYA